MLVDQFIFSEKASQRITRHVVFWLVFALHIFFFRFYVYDLKYLSYAGTYTTRLKDLLLFLPVSVFYAYFSIYFLLPRYILKEEYLKLLSIIFLLSVLLLLFSYTLSILFNVKLAWDMPPTRADIVKQTDFAFNNGIVYPLTVSGFAIGIKMSKNFYLQQKQNAKLAKQKINADVQLLKSQVHPRFLLHSLKTIHDDLLNGSQKSPEMLLKLSELLSYILYESDKKMLLEKELLLLQNYIDLEKTSWGTQLVVKISNDKNTKDEFIEPLLLLPLAEYVFDNIDKQKHHQTFLNLQMKMKENVFLFGLAVSGLILLPENGFEDTAHLLQVQKRLQAQYPGKHHLEVINHETAVSISLSIDIEKAFQTV